MQCPKQRRSGNSIVIWCSELVVMARAMQDVQTNEDSILSRLGRARSLAFSGARCLQSKAHRKPTKHPWNRTRLLGNMERSVYRHAGRHCETATIYSL